MRINTLILLTLLLLVPAAASADAQTYSSPGTYSFTVPNYSSLSVTVNGAGGQGGPCHVSLRGTDGGASSFNGSVVGYGGGGGGPMNSGQSGSPGAASGGDSNVTGGGAAGGTGYGGCGFATYPGGAGGRAVKSYAAGSLTPGASVTVVVGSGGSGGGGSYQGSAGASGSVVVTYTISLPSASRNLTVNDSVSVNGNVTVSANLTKGSGTFLIDDPSDPAHRLLYHSFVESPDALNEYTGTAVIGKDGTAMIRLPNYFEALNGDYQYFLRGIDAPMPDLHVSREVEGNAFVVAGGVAGKEISWLVTGIRHDPYILANPIITEVEKGPDQLVDKGEYLYEGYESTCSTLVGCVWDRLLSLLKRAG